MNSQEDQNWKRRLQELEAEINQGTSPPVSPTQTTQTTQSLDNQIIALKAWFNRLPNVAKVAVGTIAIVIVFSLLTTALRLVASLLSTVILAVILYLLYKFFIAPRPSE